MDAIVAHAQAVRNRVRLDDKGHEEVTRIDTNSDPRLAPAVVTVPPSLFYPGHGDE